LFPVLYILADTAVVFAAVHVVYWFRAEVLLAWVEPIWHPLWVYQRAAVVVAVIWGVTFSALGLYGPARTTSFGSEIVRILRGVFLVVVACMAASYATKFEFSRLILALFAAVAFTFAVVERYLIRVLKDTMQRRGLFQTRVVVVGTEGVAHAVAERIRTRPAFGYSFVGFVDDAPRPGTEPYLGTLNDVAKIVREHYVDEVLVAKPSMAREAVLELIAAADDAGTPVKVLFGPLEFGAGSMEERSLGDILVLDFGGD